MDFLQQALRECPEYKSAYNAIKDGRTPLMLTSLSRVHKSNIIDTMPADFSRRALVVVADEGEAARLKENLQSLNRNSVIFPARDLSLRHIESISHEFELQRTGVLTSLINGNDDIIIAPVDALMINTVPKDILNKHIIKIDMSSTIDIDEFARMLINSGYTRSPLVEGMGQFSIRGGIIDVFVPSQDNPVRIELWDTDIDSIVTFDVQSQRRIENIDSITISPAREIIVEDVPALIENMTKKAKSVAPKNEIAGAKIYDEIDILKSGIMLNNIDKYYSLIYDTKSTMLDYIDDALIFIHEPNKVFDRVKSFTWQHGEDIKAMLSDGTLCRSLTDFALTPNQLYYQFEQMDTILLETFTATGNQIAPKEIVNFNLLTLSAWGGMVKDLSEELIYMKNKGYSSVVLAGSERASIALCETLKDFDIDAVYYDDVPKIIGSKSVIVTKGGLSGGIEFPHSKLAVFTHSLTNSTKKRRKTYSAKGSAIGSLDELHKGDLVVHSVYGIGVFEGINKIENAGITKDYIKIKYLKDDILYVPVTQMDLVSRYIGSGENSAVKLSNLNSDQWSKTKKRVKQVVKDMAKELIALYAKRMQTKGFKFSEDTDLQHDFEYHFPFDETDDQLRSVNEIKADMEKDAPMERLLCGDVGFGKTEVALRAAFKCVCDGKQCAILVPTTILAWQHYKTILQRMEHFAVNVEMLSRFRTTKEQSDIKTKLRRGQIDIIVGTHKLIANDIKFNDLGLLIVDEEQRFGVAQKEKIKQAYPNVDVLTLSATPIPRTLNMAMSGLRDMSVLEEAPLDRHPVQTYVLEHNSGVIIDAIRKELSRGGQVYYIYNRVETITRVAAKIQKALPDANIAIAHGQMSENELSDVWRRLIDREIDVLVCTTIIETGVDVPNANTMIVEDADHFGLSQLHQLRGRVGRSTKRAYAYLTFKRGKVLTDIAQKRLEAIREYTEFGSGFKIAMRDLEIRGAGNILGAKQHGQMESVGYDMYLKLLNDAIKTEKGEESITEAECTVDLQIPAHIPEKYIEDLPSRLQIYRRIAQIRNEDDSSDVIDELIDRFGEPPSSVKGLIDIALLRNRAAKLNITEISDKTGEMRIFFSYFELDDIMKLIKLYNGKAKLQNNAKPYIIINKPKTQKTIDAFSEFINQYELIFNKNNGE